MAYEPKPGQFSLFKNDRKEKDTHPDYRGDGVALDGTPCWISAWLKEGAKGKFFSISLQPKDRPSQDDFRGSAGGDARDVSRGGGGGDPRHSPGPRKSHEPDLDPNDIPFLIPGDF